MKKIGYRNNRGRRKGKTARKLINQIAVCLVLVLMIIGVKKMDYDATDKVLDVFHQYISKDVSAEEIVETMSQKGKAFLDKPKELANQLMGDDEKQYAFSLPTDEAVTTVFQGSDTKSMSFSSEEEMQVYSVSNGVIADISRDEISGMNVIKVDHGDGVFTTYLGCTNVYVKRLQKVRKGDMIGSVGVGAENTLVFQVEKDGKPDDISNYIKNT